MNALTLDRRAMMGASAAAALLPAAAVSPASAAAVDRSAWAAAMDRYDAAVAADEAFTADYWRIHARWEAGRPSLEAIHWREFAFEDRDRVARLLDLDQRWAEYLAGEGRTWSSADPDATKARYRAALDSVRTWRDANERHDRESGMVAAEDRWEALGDEVDEARTALMALPAPDLAALQWKLAHLLSTENGSVAPWSDEYVAMTKTDMVRLLSS